MASVKAALPGPRVPLVDQNGNVNSSWYSYFQAIHLRTGGNPVDKVEEAAQVGAVAQTAADNANAAAAVAQAAADAAAADAGGVNSYANLANSYVLDDLTTTGHDAGSNVTVTISNHHRRYGDGTVVAVTGGTVTALGYSTAYSIYYDDPARSGGTETYHAVLATASTDAFPSTTNPNRHFVGTILTPAALAADTTGKNGIPPTYPDI